MNQKSSIFGGAVLLTVANLFMRLVSIRFNVFLSAQIGASGLGLLQLISTIGLFAMLVGTSGVRVSAMYLAAEEFGHRRLGGVKTAISVCLRYGLLISVCAGFVLLLSSDLFAIALLGDPRAALSLRVMGVFLPFSCLCGVMTGYFTACGRIRQLVVIEIAERLIGLVLTVALLVFWASGDAEKACCAVTLGSCLGAMFDFFLLYAQYRRDVRSAPPYSGQKQMKTRLRQLCVPLALNDYLRSGLNTAEQLLIPYGLIRFGSSGEQALADYGTIHAMVFPVLMFPACILYSVADLLVPELSRCRAMGRSLRVIDLTDKCLRLCSLFATVTAGLLLLNSQSLGEAIYHSSGVGTYLKIFAPMTLMLYLDCIADGLLKGLAEQVACVRYNTLTSLLDVIFLFLLLPRYGIIGYIFSFFITHAINLILSLRRLLNVTQHKMRLTELLRPLMCASPVVVLCSFLPQEQAPVRSALFLAGVLCIFVLSNTLREKELLWLRRVTRFPRRLRRQAKKEL